MLSTRCVLRRVGALFAGAGVCLSTSLLLASCGLISSDVTNVDVTLHKKFTIDTGSWQVSQATADQYLSQSCESSPSACDAAVDQFCPMNCTGTCNADQLCDLSLNISLSQSVNLVMEKPELKAVNDEPVIKVGIDSVTYEVELNDLTIDTPELTVYVGPSTGFRPTDAGVKAIGTISPVASKTTSGPRPLAFTSTGQAELVATMGMFKTPFNIVIGSSIELTAGQALPSGKLKAVVHITGHAGL